MSFLTLSRCPNSSYKVAIVAGTLVVNSLTRRQDRHAQATRLIVIAVLWLAKNCLLRNRGDDLSNAYRSYRSIERRNCRQIMVGDVPVGDGALFLAL